MTVSPLSIFIREKNSAKYINYNRSAWNHRIAAYEDLSGYEQADVDCSGDQCTEDKSECIPHLLLPSQSAFDIPEGVF